MRLSASPPDWNEQDVVCFAAVPVDQVVDWSPDGYEPEEALWLPEDAFLQLQSLSEEIGLPLLSKLNLYEQTRMTSHSCGQLIARWDEMRVAVEGTPGAGWVAAVGLVLAQCAQSNDLELLIEGP